MKRTTTTGLLGCLALGSAIYLGTGAAGVAPAAPSSAGAQLGGLERGVTKPSDEHKLVFAGPGVVSAVSVKEGDVVKAGQVVANQDDTEEKAKFAVAQGEIVSADLQIKAAEADLEQKKVELRRKEQLYSDVVAAKKTNLEIEEARVAVTIGDIAVQYRRQEKAQKLLESSLQKVKIEQKHLVAPIDGMVSKVDIHAGEGTDLTKPAIAIVTNNPLWVEVDVPSAKGKTLRPKQTLEVRYTDEEQWMPAEITLVSPVANAGANVQRIRLQMPNPQNRVSGLPVVVKVPDAVAGADR